MNSRYVVLLAALVLIIVAEIAGEGGPIDSLVKGEVPQDSDDLIAPTSHASSSPQGASDFFSDYEPEDMSAPLGAASSSDDAFGHGTVARKAPSLGALSKEQLNVEEPVGLASMRETLR